MLRAFSFMQPPPFTKRWFYLCASSTVAVVHAHTCTYRTYFVYRLRWRGFIVCYVGRPAPSTTVQCVFTFTVYIADCRSVCLSVDWLLRWGAWWMLSRQFVHAQRRTINDFAKRLRLFYSVCVWYVHVFEFGLRKAVRWFDFCFPIIVRNTALRPIGSVFRRVGIPSFDYYPAM